MNSWAGLNRRKFPRVSYPCMITLKHADEKSEVLLTHTENLGIGGVCVVIKHSIKLFTPVELEVDLMDASNHIKCQGKIVWCIRRKTTENKKPSFYDVGVEFSDIPFADQRRLDEIVSRLEKTIEIKD